MYNAVNNHSFIVLLFSLSLSGCGADDPWGRREVTGQVSLDGKPLVQGSIRFEPVGKQPGVTAGAVIRDGKYEIARERGLAAGSYRVSISAPPDDLLPPRPSMNAPRPLPKDRIPTRYNTNSELVVEVGAQDPAILNFELTSSSTRANIASAH